VLFKGGTTIRVWDMAAGKEERQVRGHGNFVVRVV
jgi:hypothetical protein